MTTLWTACKPNINTLLYKTRQTDNGHNWSTVCAFFGYEIGKRDSQAKLSCLVFPSLYGGPNKANHSYCWQIHAGLASEGMMPPFRRNLALGIVKRPWTQPAFGGALPQWLKSQPQTPMLQLLQQQQRCPRDCGGGERAPTCGESYPSLGLCLLRM